MNKFKLWFLEWYIPKKWQKTLAQYFADKATEEFERRYSKLMFEHYATKDVLSSTMGDLAREQMENFDLRVAVDRIEKQEFYSVTEIVAALQIMFGDFGRGKDLITILRDNREKGRREGG